MSGPMERSTGRAVKANQLPLGAYAAGWPPRTTSWAISRVAFGVDVTSTDGEGDPSTTADGDALAVGGPLGELLGGLDDGLDAGVSVGLVDGDDEAAATDGESDKPP